LPILLLFPLAVTVEVFRAVTRRSLVQRWALDNQLQLRECRYRLLPFSANWLVHYRVEVIDEAGKEAGGLASVTGFLRRRVWIDWD